MKTAATVCMHVNVEEEEDEDVISQIDVDILDEQDDETEKEAADGFWFLDDAHACKTCCCHPYYVLSAVSSLMGLFDVSNLHVVAYFVLIWHH